MKTEALIDMVLPQGGTQCKRFRKKEQCSSVLSCEKRNTCKKSDDQVSVSLDEAVKGCRHNILCAVFVLVMLIKLNFLNKWPI